LPVYIYMYSIAKGVGIKIWVCISEWRQERGRVNGLCHSPSGSCIMVWQFSACMYLLHMKCIPQCDGNLRSYVALPPTESPLKTNFNATAMCKYQIFAVRASGKSENQLFHMCAPICFCEAMFLRHPWQILKNVSTIQGIKIILSKSKDYKMRLFTWVLYQFVCNLSYRSYSNSISK